MQLGDVVVVGTPDLRLKGGVIHEGQVVAIATTGVVRVKFTKDLSWWRFGKPIEEWFAPHEVLGKVQL